MRQSYSFLYALLLSLITYGYAGDTLSEPSLATVIAKPPEIRSNLKIDIDTPTGLEAEDYYRPGVVAYGLLDDDKEDDYYTLDQYLVNTGGRGSYIKISELSKILRQEATEQELITSLRDLDAVVEKITSNGHKIQLVLSCMLPHRLAKYEGHEHSVLTGQNVENGEPIYACGPLKDDTLTFSSHQEWENLMQKVSGFFSKYGDNIAYVIGNEPNTYFAGTAAEYFDVFATTASGLRAGYPQAKIGGINIYHDETKMSRAKPRYHAPSYGLGNNTDSYYEFEAEILPRPILQLWLEFLHNKSFPINIVQVKKFEMSPVPADSGDWVRIRHDIDLWLKANPGAHYGQVSLIFADFPGWHTVCSEYEGQIESIWDSEYFSAWFVSSFIAMKSHAGNTTGIISDVQPLLSFLLEYGIDTYFGKSCEITDPEDPYYTIKQRPAGFGGAIGLITKSTKLPKPILHSLKLLTSLEGNLLEVQHLDQNIQAAAAYDDEENTLTLLLSHFIPSEINYHTVGPKGYKKGQLFFNDFGYELIKNFPPGLLSMLGD
jgi:hypothetical protein